ncbi:MAG: hypothetical protein J6Y78_06110 [Paludibacteraceae bacterium]|nr:hypothetical protein [Paludibacteraceae bacterium]
MKKYRMNIDGYGTRNNSIVFEAIVEAESEEDAQDLGFALADVYENQHPEIEEWDVVNIEELEG